MHNASDGCRALEDSNSTDKACKFDLVASQPPGGNSTASARRTVATGEYSPNQATSIISSNNHTTQLGISLPAPSKETLSDTPSFQAQGEFKLPIWGRGSSEAPPASTTASVTASTSMSQARAAPRDHRPPPSRYHREEDSYLPAKNRDKVAAMKGEAGSGDPSWEEFERKRREIRADVDQYNHNKRDDKHATTNLHLLHRLRQPLKASQEHRIQAQVGHYAKLGESPANWPVDANTTQPGQASAAFARSRLELRGRTVDTEVRDHIATRASQVMPRKSNESNTEPRYYAATHAKQHQAKRNPRWATTSETKAEAHEVDSNAWGSVIPDDATQSGDSVAAINDGNVFVRRDKHEADAALVGWDGGFMQPPIDWERRPRMHSQRFYPGFGDYGVFLEDVFHHQYPEICFAAIPPEKLMDIGLHADGIGLAPRSHTITAQNIMSYFGYGSGLEDNVRHEINKSTSDDFDREGRSDHVDLEELGYAETSEVYCQRFLAYISKHAAKSNKVIPQPEPEAEMPTVATCEPLLSIYLRPAAYIDLPQLTEIYNWHIANGPRPAEMVAIPESDMRDRFDEAVDHKLPFIVAVEKVKAKKQNRARMRSNGMASNHPIQNTNPNYQAVIVEEKIVGWGYATDWSASDYVERISAEIEIYVDPKYRLLGVGKCLMDKMLQICDRGYLVRGGYDFNCLPEKAHMYSEGGARDLHKIYFILRTWSTPLKTVNEETTKKIHDQEDEYDLWLKEWLESWDFEQEGRLKQIGVKNGR
ncbi:uncharacterized protein HMPREF1541_04054 [Cyphellophora europaea CBS 101466]|uniref:N-acetyltransferase domain-containing protein n=1 Tax=Cyphellophora europaea (strain CBS 101466) TaxID=1220924 RepID=W2S0J5_CYPE1|nr:uncharacterized protein HMPREF1541_04054 [Cyphellophora europaea CBS 101466]ETN42115.1 hypothetical protein HMPREF1541_04054 [Cyphellophora europaea CBS 101466]